jgi:hypothetical protein
VYYSKWVLTLDFKGWRVCAFSREDKWKLFVPFVGPERIKIADEKAPGQHCIPEELKDSYYSVKAEYLKKTPWYGPPKEAYEEALGVYTALEENVSSIVPGLYHEALAEAVFDLQQREKLLHEGLVNWSGDDDGLAAHVQSLVNPKSPGQGLIAPSLEDIKQRVTAQGLQMDERLLRRYHLALETRKFVILSGVSGTGKTWLTQAYAQAVGAKYLLVSVAPNWRTNEDLLGYFNPITQRYHYTEFSHFLMAASAEYKQAQEEGRQAQSYHLVLDEMNLARVEYYFAKLLSVMEVRMRQGIAPIELVSGELLSDSEVSLTPNLYFIGTVNLDETTHGFADKVYDRAQLIELTVDRQQLVNYLGERAYANVLMEVWDAIHSVAPFAFRVMGEVVAYVEQAEEARVPWQDALDEQLLQKVLPKFKGVDARLGEVLQAFIAIAEQHEFELSRAKAEEMLNNFREHGFASYFQ